MKKFILRNKSLFIILIVTILFISSITVYAYSSLTSFKPTYGTLTSNVNFRTTASTSTGKIRTLSKGTSVKMVGTIDNFYIVQLGTNEVGVLSKSYVKSSSSIPKGAKTYTRVAVQNVTTTDKVNLRRGPGTNFAKVTTISKGTSLKTVGYIENWYIVVTSNNQVGCIRKDLLKISSTSSGNTNTSTNNTTSFSMSSDEKIIFDLLNKARTNAGLAKLSADKTLFKVARLKAQDMVKNSYFSHTSPSYGSPFKMMKTYGVSYKVAGENIAGNPSLQDAVTAWLNSPTHKQNILSNSYNYIGIGIEKSDTYGYVISTMFIRQVTTTKTNEEPAPRELNPKSYTLFGFNSLCTIFHCFLFNFLSETDVQHANFIAMHQASLTLCNALYHKLASHLPIHIFMYRHRK